MKLFEIFNSRSDVRWSHGGHESTGIFFVESKRYAVCIEMLNLNSLVLPNNASTTLKNMKLASVMFGNIDDAGFINVKTKDAPKSTQTLKILGSVCHATQSWVKSNRPDVLVFAAKSEDNKEMAKANIYSLIANRAAKENDFVVKKLSSNKGHYFLLVKNDFYRKMTEADKKILENEALGVESKTLASLMKK